MPTTADDQVRLIGAIVAWRADASAADACPACCKAGLVIVDRSARPHAEWYAMSCAACGLSETLHIPLGAPVPTLD